MTFQEAALPFDLPGTDELGILVVHGFTSTPGSMLGWAQGLNAAGYHCVCALLPAHGTVWTDLNKIRWQDWEATIEATYQNLAKKHKRVAVVGLSLGGALTLNLATKHPEIAGLVLLNHLLILNDIRVPLSPIIRLFLAGVPAIAGDIKKPGVVEPAYTMTPTGGVDECRKLTKQLKPQLPALKMPVLMLKSREDHVVPIVSTTYTHEKLGSARKEVIWLDDSYHVASMDNDLPIIIDESVKFLRSL